MLKKFLRDVITLVVGKQAEEIADLLLSKKHVNEFLIAKKLGITINQTRNILYKISDQGLVSSIRKKDKKKGWYTYFWRIEVLKSLEFLRDYVLKRMEQINNQIKSREVKQYYYCEKCNVEYSEENALLNDFTCPECGGIFVIKDNTKLLHELKKNINRLERELKTIQDEIQIEKDRLGKERTKEDKKQKKEKDEIRKNLRLNRMKERKLSQIKPKKDKSKRKKLKKISKKKSIKKVFKKLAKKAKNKKRR